MTDELYVKILEVFYEDNKNSGFYTTDIQLIAERLNLRNSKGNYQICVVTARCKKIIELYPDFSISRGWLKYDGNIKDIPDIIQIFKNNPIPVAKRGRQKKQDEEIIVDINTLPIEVISPLNIVGNIMLAKKGNIYGVVNEKNQPILNFEYDLFFLLNNYENLLKSGLLGKMNFEENK